MVSPFALSFSGVSKRFGKTLALEDVTFAVSPGSRTCLLGPNGAGKSTSIRLLEGALKPTTGHITLLGTTPGTPPYEHARRKTGIVPQGPGMYEELSVGEYLELTRRLFGVKPDKDVAAVFGLEPYLKQRLARLSGGFQRRVVVAAALLADPEVLLLDEPTVGLDPLARHEVKEFLRSRMQGKTTLLCTHNLAEAQELCEQVVILQAGRVLLQSKIKELLAQSGSYIEIASPQGASKLSMALAALGKTPATLNEDHVRFLVEDVKTEVPVLLKALLTQGLEIYEVRVVQASLEEVFLEKLGSKR